MGLGKYLVLVSSDRAEAEKQHILDEGSGKICEGLRPFTLNGGQAVPLVVISDCRMTFSCDACDERQCPGCGMAFVLDRLADEEIVTCVGCLNAGSLEAYVAGLYGEASGASTQPPTLY